MFEVAGNFAYLIHRLFPHDVDGHLTFGWARTAHPVTGSSALGEWVEFRDYIMEGHVRYWLRVVPTPAGLRLEVRLVGTNRDQYIRPSLQDYIRWAGLSPVAVLGSAAGAEPDASADGGHGPGS